MVVDLLELSRPKHWVKNLFVLMPLPFALAAGNRLDPVVFLLGLGGFCLANSAVYSFNDVQDAERDRLHPTKRNRPVASGRVSAAAGTAWSAALVVLGSWLAVRSGAPGALAVLLSYVLMNFCYSVGARHIPLVDVFVLSSGFVLRVVLGCVLVGASPSNWLLLCSSTLALFLALGKRRADLAHGLDETHRPSLAGYTIEYLDHAMTLAAGMTLISYALYTMEAVVLIPGREFATLPFVVFGVLDYMRVSHVRKEGGSPVDLIVSSPTIILCGLGWIVAALFSVKPA
ncbi:MAG TPA: UbiA prenyltransferase family protein [Gammaproteobacteria bacterium]